ncbi:hypothetical protein L211DRAFT_119579 [Terfezia boudieri ATCC MYA-4762]|uniref:GAR domain-containing protein n=1 Tax=Terfezia boudieri ATCC MYA-4762 TaxID=1051890 RepID=A0A3N4LR19_9PEZI|nr:hypothetical protein L211DRAFT_119579 [Terfezia boudieri ATCC MYA-4762]
MSHSPPPQPWPAHRSTPLSSRVPSHSHPRPPPPLTYFTTPFSTTSSTYSTSPTHSPTRSLPGSTTSSISRYSLRIRTLVSSDPLLSRLTPQTIYKLAQDESLGFTPGERDVCIRAAEAGARIGGWVREVEGWTRAWEVKVRSVRERMQKQKPRENNDKYVKGGEGFLPRRRHLRKNRKPTHSGDAATREDQADSMSLSKWSFVEENIRPIHNQRGLFDGGEDRGSADNSPTTSLPASRTASWGAATSSAGASWVTPGPKKRPSVSAVNFPSPGSPLSLRPSTAKTSSSGGNGLGSTGAGSQDNWTDLGSPSSLKKRSFPIQPSRLSTISATEDDDSKDDNTRAESPSNESVIRGIPGSETCSDPAASDDSASTTSSGSTTYWGCLPASTVLRYEERIEEIRCQIDDLDIEGLKSAVLTYRPLTYPLSDPSAIIAATTLQLLPPLARLTNLVSTWAVRIAVLKIVPLFLKWLTEGQETLEEGVARIESASSAGFDDLDGDGAGEKEFSEDEYNLLMDSLDSKIVTAGRIMDMMLDTLDGREDTLPDEWISRMESLEEGYSNWVVDGERLVLETRLRAWDTEDRKVAMEEERRMKVMMARKDSLMWEREKVREEAKVEEERAMEVVRVAEERVDGLREVLDGAERAAEEVVGNEEGSYPELPEGEEESLLERVERLSRQNTFRPGESDEDVRTEEDSASHYTDEEEEEEEEDFDEDDEEEEGFESVVVSRGRLTSSQNHPPPLPPPPANPKDILTSVNPKSGIDSGLLIITPISTTAPLPSPSVEEKNKLLAAEEAEEAQRLRLFKESQEAHSAAEVARLAKEKEKAEVGAAAEEARVAEEARLAEAETLRILEDEFRLAEEKRLAAIPGEKTRERVAALEEAERRRREEEAEAIRLRGPETTTTNSSNLGKLLTRMSGNSRITSTSPPLSPVSRTSSFRIGGPRPMSPIERMGSPVVGSPSVSRSGSFRIGVGLVKSWD